MQTEVTKSSPVAITKPKVNTKPPCSNLNNYYTHYNNYLSCQIPPNHNSPPESDFIYFYLNSRLQNQKLNLNREAYSAYK